MFEFKKNRVMWDQLKKSHKNNYKIFNVIKNFKVF